MQFDLGFHCPLTVTETFNVIFTLSIMATVDLFKVRKSMVRSEVIPIFRVNTVDTSIEYVRDPKETVSVQNSLADTRKTLLGAAYEGTRDQENLENTTMNSMRNDHYMSALT